MVAIAVLECIADAGSLPDRPVRDFVPAAVDDVMHTIAQNAALLLIDLQKGFDAPAWGRRNNPRLEARVGELLGAWRGSRRPVIHVRHMSTDPRSPLRPGQRGNEFIEHLAPQPGERVIEKRVNSCFIGTSLERHLRRGGTQALVIVGLTTNHCVSTTARMAGNLGFRAWVVSDATATFDRTGPDGVRHRAEQIHSIALADLHGEFATVVDTAATISALRTSRPRTPRNGARR
jgi:nicotinamidase-related amidase